MKIIYFVLAIMISLSALTGCEKPDYQHPLHRSK